MSELGPRAREILRSGRDLNRPTDADRERVESALRERLGAALLLAESSKAVPAVRPRWPFVSSFVVGAGLVGGGIFFGTRHAPEVASTPPAVIAVASTTNGVSQPPLPAGVSVPELATSDTPEPVSAASPKPVSSATPEPVSERAVASARPAEDRLAQEVALLGRATSSLHAGHPADALKTLDEYQRRFPKGQLSEERRAARAQALCALGRQSEAATELARLAPQSLAAARARQVCDARSALKK
ncbi:MAG TPA: hypothetical protein VER96_09355 [Polyangiaceae bacterium]|nr:hypothetical protein [Polyangiaceae bacterium]